MSVPVNIRANVRVPFPALVLANFPLSVAKANGIWTFNIDVSDIAQEISNTVGGIPHNYRAVTATPVSILGSPQLDYYLGIDTIAINAAWNVQLPTAASRNSFALIFKDIGGVARNFPGTFTPAGTETIEGVNSAQVLLNIDRQSVTLIPILTGRGAPGWLRI